MDSTYILLHFSKTKNVHQSTFIQFITKVIMNSCDITVYQLDYKSLEWVSFGIYNDEDLNDTRGLIVRSIVKIYKKNFY